MSGVKCPIHGGGLGLSDDVHPVPHGVHKTFPDTMGCKKFLIQWDAMQNVEQEDAENM